MSESAEKIRELTEALTLQLVTEDQAAEWLRHMHRIGYLGHPDEDGGELIHVEGGRSWPLFTGWQADRYNERMDQVFTLVRDPYAIVMEVVERADRMALRPLNT
jgi:hypothetical protein